jgi:hypothetical protein
MGAIVQETDENKKANLAGKLHVLWRPIRFVVVVVLAMQAA